MGYLTNLEKEVSVDPNNSEQVSEIKQIQWVTKEEALKIIDEVVCREVEWADEPTDDIQEAWAVLIKHLCG